MIRTSFSISQAVILALTAGYCANVASPKFLRGTELYSARGGQEDCTVGPDVNQTEMCLAVAGAMPGECTEEVKRCDTMAFKKTHFCSHNGSSKSDCKLNTKCEVWQWDDTVYNQKGDDPPCKENGL